MVRLKIYEIKGEYVEYLSKYHEHLFYEKKGSNKRKYIGINLTEKVKTFTLKTLALV